MPCWFDYKQFAFENLESSVDFDQLIESKERVTEVIKEEIKENLGGDASKLFIGGFSQGAALSLYTACEFEENLGAVLSFSGHQLYAAPVTDINESKKSIRVFAYHGEQDPLLPFEQVFGFFGDLEKAGFAVESHSEKGLAHSVSPTELKKAREFIANILKI